MAGIRPDRLAELAARGNGINPEELERWLLDARLATLHGGLLRPTKRALQLGVAIV